jgi:hypothetical protein
LNATEHIESRSHRFDSVPRIPQWNKSPSRNSKVKKMFYIVIVAMVTFLLGGCFDNGSSAAPPSNFTATAGDGRVKIEWTPDSGVDYWLFAATNPSLTAFNWTGLPNAQAYIKAATPFYLCGLIDGTTTYFAINGRINGGPGGSSSPTISKTPYNASAQTWTLNPTSLIQDIYGVGYTSLTTCTNNGSISAAGTFAAVGATGAIFTSTDGISWTGQSSPITTNLNAVAGYAANQNNAATPGLRWVAVGDGGAAVYSTDGITWSVGATTTTQSLHAITQVSGTFFAVGDAGTILSSIDGNTWTSHTATSGTTNRLNGVTHGGIYVAVGDGGTILASSDGSNWTARPSPTTSNLHQVTSFVSVYGTIYVALGDAGTIVTSKDGGTTWTTQTLAGSPNLVGITVESRGVETTTAYTTAPAADPSLGFVSTAQFVAIDSNGNAYTSVNGYIWSAAIPTGATGINALVSSGFGYVTAGNAGTSAYVF